MDAPLVELPDGSFQEPGGGGGGGFVSVYFGVPCPGAVVEGGVDVSITDFLGGSCLSFAVYPPAASLGNAGQFFDVDMNQLAGPFTLVAPHLGRGGPVALVEAAQPGVGENPMNSRSCQPDLVADPGRPPPVPDPQTDMGNVSLRLPAIHPFIGIDSLPAGNHQPGFTAAAARPAADQAVIAGAVAMAWTAIDAASDPALAEQLQAEAADRSP